MQSWQSNCNRRPVSSTLVRRHLNGILLHAEQQHHHSPHPHTHFDRQQRQLPHALTVARLHSQARQQHIKRARKLYHQALASDPTHGPSLRGLASMEARSGRVRRAARLYQRGHAADSSNLHTLHSIAQLHRQLHQRQVCVTCVP